jgi:hypothetical protein
MRASSLRLSSSTVTLRSNGLWGRPQQLAAPLQALEPWSPEALHGQVLPLLNPALACQLEAVPA